MPRNRHLYYTVRIPCILISIPVGQDEDKGVPYQSPSLSALRKLKMMMFPRVKIIEYLEIS
jgi:hypothetical protein